MRVLAIIPALVSVADASFSESAFALSLRDHFASLRASKAHERVATHLPASAAAAVLHLDLSKFTDPAETLEARTSAEESSFGAMLGHASNANLDVGRGAPHILCGPQSHAKANRASLTAATGGATVATQNGKTRPAFDVAFASRQDEVACWSAVLTPAAAAALADADGFFHVSPIPPAAKLAPNLVDIVHHGETTRLAPAAGAIKDGASGGVKAGGTVMAYFDPNIAASAVLGSPDAAAARAKVLAELATLVEGWRGAGFGLTDKDSAAAARKHFSTGHWWRAVHEAVAGASDCAAHLTVEATVGSLRGARLTFVRKPEADADVADACCLAAMAFVAAQPEVHEVALKAAVKVLARDASISAKPRVPEDRTANKRSLNFMAVHALQSGDVGTTPLWDAGITGGGQLVQVVDTGFDDASCFLRDTDATDGDLTGSFNGDVQVARSTWDATVTDLTKRKVVQYVAEELGGDYEYDYFSGHGTHVAGTVAGSIGAGDASTVTFAQEDYYSNCIDYVAYCDDWFCATCGSDAGYCDKTCNFIRSADEDYTGMAPDAQLMVLDFGNVNGSLTVPSDYRNELFAPAYAAGARISTNSWGGGAFYYSTEVDVDAMIYELDDYLILGAAGNDGAYGADTVGSPATGKNILSVGAAETAASPDTIAVFSSRGPTKDMRLKPDLVGPGDAIVSTCASGQPGLGSCQVSSKSGTSMATPAVAGAAALVRQFLVEGHHATYSPDGAAVSSYDASNPSSALLKAILIGSTIPLKYGYDMNGDTVLGAVCSVFCAQAWLFNDALLSASCS